MFNDMLIKIAIGVTTSVVATVCLGQDFYLTCDGDRSTEIVDRDSETRRDILRVQQIPSKRYTQTFIIRGGKVFVPGAYREVGNCEIGQFLIKCERPLTQDPQDKNWWQYYELEINRINGLIKERFGTHAYGGKVNGRNSVQISSSDFDGNCKKTNQLAF